MGCERCAVLAATLLVACNQVLGLNATTLEDTVTYVQGGQHETNGAPDNVAFKDPVSKGDAVMVAVYSMGKESPMVSDAVGNAYDQLLPPAAYVPYNATMYLFLAMNVTGGHDTVTVTASDSSDLIVYIHELANVVALDGASGSNSDTTGGTGLDQMTSGFMQTTNPNDMLFGFGVATSVGAGDGFLALLTLDSNLTEQQIVGPPGMYEAKANAFNSKGWTLIAAALRGP